MTHRTMRRALAAASATAMAGAALVVGGAGVASAAKAEESQTYKGAFASDFRITRTVDEASPTYGDKVTVRTHVQRTSLGDLLYGVRSDVPSCFERIVGTTDGQADGGSHITEPHNQFAFSGNRVSWTGPGVGPWFWMETDYRVLCDAGSLPTGGAEFASVAGQYKGSMTLGPMIDVQRLGTTMYLAQPAHPEVKQTVTLRATTTNVPDGGVVSFAVDDQHVGNGTVSNNQAVLAYVPTTAGSKQVRANFIQTSTHGGSVSQVREMNVSPTNVDSTVSVTASADAKVGRATTLTATVSPADAGGEIVFSEEGTQIGAVKVDGSGDASLEWIPAVPGDRSIDVAFTGSPGVKSSNGGLLVSVADADPTDVATSISIDQIPNTPLGEQITLKASVDPSNVGGNVSFYDGATLIGTVEVDGNGQATVNWTPSTDGDRTVRAVFSGHGVYLSSQATVQAFIAPAIVEPEPDPDPIDPPNPSSGSLGSLTGSGGAGNDSGSLGSLSNFGS